MDLTRADTDKPTDRIHDVDLLIRTGISRNSELTLPQLLVYLNDSEGLISALFNLN